MHQNKASGHTSWAVSNEISYANRAAVPWLGPAQARVRHVWGRSTDSLWKYIEFLCVFTYAIKVCSLLID